MRKNIKKIMIFVVGIFIIFISQIFFMNNINQQPILNNNIEQSNINQIQEKVSISTGIESTVNIEGSTDIIPNIHPNAKSGIITGIIDGDTLYFNSNKYRLSLIDTYEMDEVGGAEATIVLQQLCPVGSLAYMEDDSIQISDKYGRFLGVVWCIGNDYNIDVGEYLYNHGHLKQFYTTYCDETESATYEWASESNNWFYYNTCEAVI